MIYTISKASEELGVSIQTLRNWVSKGKIKSFRSAGGHRLFPEEEIRRLKGQNLNKKRRAYAYARVSTKAQQDDLQRQEEVLRTFCVAKGWEYTLISDIGSGLNYNKKGLNQLMDAILSDEVSHLVINYEDRLLRFGNELIFRMCKAHDTDVVIIANSEDKTYEQELTEDVLSIITVFSAKLYGSRSHKAKKITEELKKEFKQ